MKKKYKIEGLDCPHCAEKCEKHLAKHEKISSCEINFQTSVLSVEFVDEDLTINEMQEIIKEVEDDEVVIKDIKDNKKDKKRVVFTKENIFIFVKIVISLVLGLIGLFVFKDGSDLHHWMRFSFFLLAYLICIYDLFIEVIETIAHKENPLDEDLLMIIAASGAFTLAAIFSDDYLDGLLVLILFHIGEIIESITSNKSKDAVINAVDLRAEYANVIKNEDVEKIEVSDVHIGDKVLIKLGEKIPCDGTIISGNGYVDTSSLNGELMPVLVNEGDYVNSGCVLTSGSLTVLVDKEFEDSTSSKLLSLITESESKKSKADLFISKFAKIYTPVVVGLAVVFILVASLITGQWSTFIYRGLEFLVASCPCALVISIPLAYFASIGKASRNGIVIKGSAYVDSLATSKVLVSDKTGTLTTGKFEIKEIKSDVLSNDELLEIIAGVESMSNHPIAKAIVSNVKNYKKASSFNEIVGEGLIGKIDNKKYFVGSSKLMKRFNVSYNEIDDSGLVIYAASEDKYLGYIVLNDLVKESSLELVRGLKAKNIKTVLLTGDKKNKAEEISKQLEIDEYHYELTPEDKMKLLEAIIEKNDNHVIYLGDGNNDIPCLKLADVGISMGGIGSDSAVNASDVIIMDDDPLKVMKAIKISKSGRNTAIFNIVFSLLVKLAVIVLAMFGLIPMWIAVIADTGLTVLLSLNSLRLLIQRKKK